MRIIAGKYKAKRIIAPKNIKARPTTDFAKEGMFNVLANSYDFEGLDVLDLFAGTGNISYEFCSRGASKVVAVDIALATQKFLYKMKKEMDIPLTIIKGDVFRFVRNHIGKYDIVFADPPYQLDKLDSIPDLVLNQDILKPNGVLIVEHDNYTDFSGHKNLMETRKYGRVQFSFFKPKTD